MSKKAKKHNKKTHYAAVDTNLNINEISIIIHGYMKRYNLKTFSVKYLPEIDSYNIVYIPDKDYGENKDFMDFCECIGMCMEYMELLDLQCSLTNNEFNLSVFPAAKAKNNIKDGSKYNFSLIPLSIIKNVPLAVVNTNAIKKHLAKSVEAAAKCLI